MHYFCHKYKDFGNANFGTNRIFCSFLYSFSSFPSHSVTTSEVKSTEIWTSANYPDHVCNSEYPEWLLPKSLKMFIYHWASQHPKPQLPAWFSWWIDWLESEVHHFSGYLFQGVESFSVLHYNGELSRYLVAVQNVLITSYLFSWVLRLIIPEDKY